MEGVIISASGNHVTKAVTVAELLKRRIPVSATGLGLPVYTFLHFQHISMGD